MANGVQHCRKPDPVVLAFCTLTLISCLGAAGEQARRRAKDMVCRANLQQWGALFGAYTDDHEGHFNPGWDVGETELWMNALRPYYGDRWSLLLCPTATQVPEFWETGTFAAWTRTTSLPNGGSQEYVSSYGINSWTNHMTRSRGDRAVEYFWGTTQDVEGPDNVPVFGDATWHDAWPRQTDAPIMLPVDLGGGVMGTVGEIHMFTIDRHSGGVDLLFMDFSARKVGLKELWTLRWHRQFDTAGSWTRAGGVSSANWPEWMRGFKDY